MKNLRVEGSPAGTHLSQDGTFTYSLPASVRIDYGSSEIGEDFAYQTTAVLLSPAQARELAIELAVAAERADGNGEAGTSLLAAMLRDVLPKKTAATGEPASPGGGLAGDGSAGECVSSSGVRDATNVAPAGPARGGERPENRGVPSEARTCGSCGQESDDGQ